jgi:hypothetical protein
MDTYPISHGLIVVHNLATIVTSYRFPRHAYVY